MDKIKQYFQTKALSNSFLGSLWNPRWVKIKLDNPDMEDEDKKYFRIGSALDCILTDPERWDEEFAVVDANKPYGLMGKFIENLPMDISVDSSVEKYQEAYDKAGYKMNINKVIEKMWGTPEITDYLIATRGIEEKTILSKDEFDIINKCAELIRANEFVAKYFKPVTTDCEVMRQVPIYFEYQNEKCKALLDGVYIDHTEKTIQPYDLKTTGKSIYDFPISFLQFGYYRQCAFYEIALKTESSPIKELLEQGYRLLDFIFIVVETKLSSSHPAVVYRTSEKDRLCGIVGGKTGRKTYLGIDQLIENYKFHRDNNYWDMTRELLESKGEIDLDVFYAPTFNQLELHDDSADA